MDGLVCSFQEGEGQRGQKSRMVDLISALIERWEISRVGLRIYD